MSSLATNHLIRPDRSIEERAEPTLTVVYPLFDVRERAAVGVRSWTQKQTLARSRYRVVVVVDGSLPDEERRIEPWLGPDDEIVRVPKTNDAGMWNAGATRAGSPWLVFTEAHCPAVPGCLEAVARWIDANPESRVGNFTVAHPKHYRMAELSERWFGLMQSEWRDPSTWRRIHRAGFAIRAESFDAVGGFDPRLGQFAAPFLSIRLHERGIQIDDVPDARVVHLDSTTLAEHHRDTIDHAIGDLEARDHYGVLLCERYVGHSTFWSNRLRLRRGVAGVMARGALLAAIADRRESRDLRPHGFFALARAAVAGTGLELAAGRSAVRLAEIAFERLWMPASWRWSLFLGAHRHVVRLAALGWARRRSRLDPPLAEAGRRPIESLGPTLLTGVHALEQHGGHRFRWTESVAYLRIRPPGEDATIEIETAGLRGDPLAYVKAVTVGCRVLPRSLLGSDGGTLVIRLPAPWAARARRGIVLVADPLVPSEEGSIDSRALGVPIVSVSLRQEVHRELDLAAG